MNLRTTPQREYEVIVSSIRIRREINTSFPNEVVTELTPGDESWSTEDTQDCMERNLLLSLRTPLCST